MFSGRRSDCRIPSAPRHAAREHVDIRLNRSELLRVGVQHVAAAARSRFPVTYQILDGVMYGGEFGHDVRKFGECGTPGGGCVAGIQRRDQKCTQRDQRILQLIECRLVDFRMGIDGTRERLLLSCNNAERF